MELLVEQVKFEDCTEVFVRFKCDSFLTLCLESQECREFLHAVSCYKNADNNVFINVKSWDWESKRSSTSIVGVGFPMIHTLVGSDTFLINLNNIAYVHEWEEHDQD